MIRKIVRGTGQTLIAAGLLILLFVGYQLWGTGLAESRSQKALASQFAGVTTPPSTTGAIVTPVAVEPPPPGDALGKIVIPKAGIDKYLVEGVGVEDLKKAPGHYPGTPMPGEPGNVAIAGHRTTYGAPFLDLDKLEIGDPIEVTTAAGIFRYDVTESIVVSPEASEVLDDTEDNRLTLTTCHPRYSAAERLIIVARLASPGIEPPPVVEGAPPTTAPPPSLAGEELAGLSGDKAAQGPAFAWGILAAAVALATWYLSHLWRRRWLAYLVGAPVFLAVLFMFFENFARLLPANV
jgi:sortase A